MKRAFTFIELLIVVVIIAVLSVLAVPRVKITLDKFQLESFVRDVYYLSLYLQDSAMSKGATYCLNFDKGNNELRATCAESEVERPFEARFKHVYKIPKGIEVAMEKPGVCFYPDSSSDDADIVFQGASKNIMNLTIRGASGEIKIE